MCGIGGYYTNSPYTKEAVVLQALLLTNSFRGTDSTGMLTFFQEENTYSISRSLKDPILYAATDLRTKITKWNKEKSLPELALIHARAATQGVVSKENCHPFEHGDLIGVHNGTILNTFDNRDKFETDSEAIYHNLAHADSIEEGLETLKGTDAALALVFFNKKDRTLSFFRNEKRPMFMAETLGGLYWSSEAAHLAMSVRAAYPHAAVNPVLLPVNVLTTYDLSKNSLKRPELTEIKTDFTKKHSYVTTAKHYAGSLWSVRDGTQDAPALKVLSPHSKLPLGRISTNSLLQMGITVVEFGALPKRKRKNYPVRSKIYKMHFASDVWNEITRRRKETENVTAPDTKEVVQDNALPFDAPSSILNVRAGPKGASPTFYVTEGMLKQIVREDGCDQCGDHSLLSRKYWVKNRKYLCEDCVGELSIDNEFLQTCVSEYTEAIMEQVIYEYEDDLTRPKHINVH